MNKGFRAYQEKARADEAFKQLRRLKERISSIVDNIPNEPEPKYTGWFVMLKENRETESGFEFLGFFNPDVSKPETEPEWSMCIPIKLFESVREFQGW